jgi:hypothetical protein
MSERPSIQLSFNPNRFSTIIDSAVLNANEVVNFYFRELDRADLSEPVEPANVRFRLNGPNMDAAARRAMHENWILSKAFQELIRALRHALEDAHVFISVLTKKHRISSGSTVDGFLSDFRRKAAGLQFPDLLAKVNDLLETKLEFADSYKSLQKARNCLEHRNGIVSHVETHHEDYFYLRVPHMKFFYIRGEEEIEIETGVLIDPGDDREEVETFMRIAEGKRKFSVGERITFTLAQFNEITFACHYLGKQLSAKLPKPSAVVADSAA